MVGETERGARRVQNALQCHLKLGGASTRLLPSFKPCSTDSARETERDELENEGSDSKAVVEVREKAQLMRVLLILECRHSAFFPRPS